MSNPSPSVNRIFEAVLYARDLEACAEFYSRGFGLKVLSRTELMLVLGCGDNHVLIFNPDLSSAKGRMVPSHGCEGEGHIAFTATEEELPAWRERLAEAGIEIESEVSWEGSRGTSIYTRDPVGNSVELAPPILWGYLRD